MMKKIKIFLLLFCLSFGKVAPAQDAPEAHDRKMAWWREARFGMFIHWGPYCLLGGVYHGHRQQRGGAEWIMNRCKIPVAEYQQIASTFNPVKYDADAWVRLAREAGMKYIVITAKHHDGFAMFRSSASSFNIVDHTPFKRDVLDELARACRKHGMKLGFYYSQAQDWNNSGGAAARKQMIEGWPNPDSAKIDAYTAAHNGHWDPAQETRSMEEYIRQVSVPQVRELLSNYGDVAVIWWDTPTGMTDEYAKELFAELEKYPQIITNDRLKRPNFSGDYRTPEQKIPDPSELDGKDWETCMTMNSSWGYKSWDTKWKTPETLIRNLINIASKGGNYLLNVGPTAEGEIPQQSTDGLKAIGQWMKINGEAIYGTQRSPVEKPAWGYVTRKDTENTTVLYLFVCKWPEDRQIILRGAGEIRTATFLTGHPKLKVKKDVILLPEQMPDPIATVIKVELKGKLTHEKTASGQGKSFEIVDEK
ncbi:MAG: alpha-L-fucosidase [Bacteroidales bacterium]|jgi:alpha-L-fucosidase|nr:alpha-L-fucosidase [Bacteroidales bacterium]